MKKVLRKIHLYLGLLTIPLGLMFAVTGTVYILGANDKTWAEKDVYTVPGYIEEGAEVDFIIPWAEENNVELPSDLSVNPWKDGVTMIGSLHYSINLLPKDNMTEITVLTRSLIGDMILLHKSKAKWYFDVLAIFFGISLISFYFSGLIIASFHRNINGKKVIKKEYLVVILIGFIITIVTAIMSF